MKFKLLFQLFISFLKIGSLAFGGGYAVIPLLQKEVVEHRKWVTHEELSDIMGISQAMPGAIMSNASTMIGYKVCSFWGALFATLASILPTFVLMLVIVIGFWGYTDFPLLRKFFLGVLIGITTLIIKAIITMWKSNIKNAIDIFLALLSAVLILFFQVHAMIVIVLCAIVGFFFNLSAFKRGGRCL